MAAMLHLLAETSLGHGATWKSVGAWEQGSMESPRSCLQLYDGPITQLQHVLSLAPPCLSSPFRDFLRPFDAVYQALIGVSSPPFIPIESSFYSLCRVSFHHEDTSSFGPAHLRQTPLLVLRETSSFLFPLGCA